MSLDITSLLFSKGIDQVQKNKAESVAVIETQRLTNAMIQLRESQPKPAIILKSTNNNLSSAVNDGVIILQGVPVLPNHQMKVEDFNINFTTTAGTVRLVVLDANNQEVASVLKDINSSTNGNGNTVMEEYQRLAVVGQTSGAGVFSVYCTGSVQKVRGFSNGF
jgi:hypothetical protein